MKTSRTVVCLSCADTGDASAVQVVVHIDLPCLTIRNEGRRTHSTNESLDEPERLDRLFTISSIGCSQNIRAVNMRRSLNAGQPEKGWPA